MLIIYTGIRDMVENLHKLREEERMGRLAKAKSAAEVRAIFSGQPYGGQEKRKKSKRG